ncbi:hypothetical protein [Actinomadura litoris]|uniref:Uncharacterized protein n=1 Tax=Actinomadura litoris TaxID=2678616 RepID=A0A7K1KWY2_9ACTN|nr:hypothetical protein [Actinomadura litoris]MUN36710.1 hypothetical protein [Actinomadura litoris]
MNRKKLGLLAVAFVLTIALMEVLALKLGSMDFLAPQQKPAVADRR